jgi:hypothetical protein
MASAPGTELYDEDFYTWTQDQAARLRALRGDNRFDADHVAEEIADLGRSELNKVRGHLRQALIHLMKAAASQADDPRAHWMAEAETHLDQARDAFSPGMRQSVDMAGLWSESSRTANRLLAAHGDPAVPSDLPCPFSLEGLLARDVDLDAAVETVRRAMEGGAAA